MIVLLDTNIIMDALQERSPFDIPAKEILLQGQNGVCAKSRSRLYNHS